MPTRLNAQEVNDRLVTLTGDTLDRLFALRDLFVNAVVPPQYVSSNSWLDAIKLSDHGREVLEGAREQLKDFSDATISQAMFLSFYHLDLLIDTDATNADEILALIRDDVTSARVTLPYRFGRELYDKFSGVFGDARPSYLEPDATQALLAGTPQGVFQMWRYTTGPLGILESNECRYLPVSPSLPLWHCADTGCNTPHEVELLTPPSPLKLALERIEAVAKDRFGPPSAFRTPLTFRTAGIRPKSSKRFYDLPTVIADCFVRDERSVLVGRAIRSRHGQLLRDFLASAGMRVSASPESIASGLSDAAQLQLLLVLRDSELVTLIDGAVLARHVVIPPAEVRRPAITPLNLSSEEFYSEISSWGVRLAGWSSVVVLETLVWNTYTKLQLVNELDWRLRNSEGKGTRHALADFVRARTPREVVTELILASQPVASEVARELDFDPVVVSHEQLADVFLWKMGFRPVFYDDALPTLRRRISEFRELLLELPEIRTEEHRERVRSYGVNLFVSVEHFIEELLTFNVWLLAADHFVDTEFTYDPSAARHVVSRVLGSSLKVDESEIAWSDRGENTLGVLLAYLNAFVTWVGTLLSGDRSRVRRPDSQMPHFASFRFVQFPFVHTELWADANPTALADYAASFSVIARKLAQSGVPAIRNGIDHKREPERFPSLDSLVAFVTRLDEVVALAELGRFVPKGYWVENRTVDRHGRSQYALRDVNGRALQLYEPASVIGIAPITFAEAIIIAPGNLLGIPNAELRFTPFYRSAYADYWRDYPRRAARALNPESEGATDDEEPSDA